MNKVIITTLLLCTGIVAAGCEKTYSVAEFKKDKNLLDEWVIKCEFSEKSKNCENAQIADRELVEEQRKQEEEESRKRREEREKKRKEDEAKRKAEYEKWKAKAKSEYNFDP